MVCHFTMLPRGHAFGRLELADSVTLINSAFDTPPISSFDLPDEEIVLPMTSGKQGTPAWTEGKSSVAGADP